MRIPQIPALIIFSGSIRLASLAESNFSAPGACFCRIGAYSDFPVLFSGSDFGSAPGRTSMQEGPGAIGVLVRVCCKRSPWSTV